MEARNDEKTKRGFTVMAGKHNFLVYVLALTAGFDQAKADSFLGSFKVVNPDAP